MGKRYTFRYKLKDNPLYYTFVCLQDDIMKAWKMAFDEVMAYRNLEMLYLDIIDKI